METAQLVAAQRNYFNTGATLPVAARKAALKKLKSAMERMESEIAAALQQDLNKCAFESYMTEVGLTLAELGYMEKHLAAFAKTKHVHTPLAQFPSRSFILHEPYGVSLIMSPWNYPFMLCMEPLINALAAGNTAVLKPSNYSPATSAVIKKLIEATFPPEYVAVVEGGREANASLLEQSFDYIFFTGSKTVGSLVMEKAAKHLTPVTLELGGKSPCIVDASANLAVAARRIAFGKFLNAGQTCVAVDYLYVHRSVKEELLRLIEKEVHSFFGAEPLADKTMCKIINEKHFARVCGLMQNEKIIFGGGTDGVQTIEPTALDNITPASPVMQEEIFGPLLPVLVYDDLQEVIHYIKSQDKPLALYLFTENKQTRDTVLQNVQYGGGCLNDTVIHLATSEMPFGGVGASGMGGYHGKDGFDTFSHKKSIVHKATWLDMPMRYRPYNKKKEKLLRMFLK